MVEYDTEVLSSSSPPPRVTHEYLFFGVDSVHVNKNLIKLAKKQRERERDTHERSDNENRLNT